MGQHHTLLFSLKFNGVVMGTIFQFRGERYTPKKLLIELPDDQHWTIEMLVLAILLMANIKANAAPPHFTFLKSRRLVVVVKFALEMMPEFEIFIHGWIIWNSRVASKKKPPAPLRKEVF